MARVPFLVQPVVEIIAADGNRPRDRRLIEVDIEGAPTDLSGATTSQSIEGSVAKVTYDGIVHFTDLALNAPGYTTLRISMSSIEANRQIFTAAIHVRKGLAQLVVAPPPNYPSGATEAGETLIPAPQVSLADDSLNVLNAARLPVFVTDRYMPEREQAQERSLRTGEITISLGDESCCRQPDCPLMFPFNVSLEAARCCDCALLSEADTACDPCIMVSHDRNPSLASAGIATFSNMRLDRPGRHYLSFRVEEFAPADDDPGGGTLCLAGALHCLSGVRDRHNKLAAVCS